jgi:hypothetical protein
MFTYLPSYRVLICCEHQQAVHSLDEHLKRHHKLSLARRRELLEDYQSLPLCLPKQKQKQKQKQDLQLHHNKPPTNAETY